MVKSVDARLCSALAAAGAVPSAATSGLCRRMLRRLILGRCEKLGGQCGVEVCRIRERKYVKQLEAASTAYLIMMYHLRLSLRLCRRACLWEDPYLEMNLI